MRCVESCFSTSFPWLVFFFRVLLWGSMVHKQTGRWIWQESASVVSWSWEKLLSIQTGFSLVNAAVVCAILEIISGLEPSSVMTESRYLKLVTVSLDLPSRNWLQGKSLLNKNSYWTEACWTIARLKSVIAGKSALQTYWILTSHHPG